MASDDTGWIGRTLADRYTITGRVGAGGMSTVYEARDEQLGRSVALKLFNPGEARDDDRRRSEVDVLARLNHPTLVTMYDAHLATGDSTVPSFLVMELVPGPDLRSTLDHGPLRGAIAAQITTDIADGLAAMHAQGIVHRDLKPANILLAPTGLPAPTHRAKLADFGIAHLVGTDRMTTVGTIIGTASYLSPEQASGANPGPEADVYALGLVILEGLTGRREYPGTVVESMSARASRDPVVGGDIPPSWVSLLTQMTARDPDARPTALDVAVRSRDIVRDLVAWEGAAAAGAAGADTVEATAAATAALPGAPTAAATVLLPDAPTAATEAFPRRGVAAAGVAGAGVAGAGVAATGASAAGAAAAGATPASTAALASEHVGPAPAGRSRKAVWLGAAAAAVVLAGAIWIGGTLMTPAPSSAPAQPVPASTQTAAPTTEPVVETTPPSDDDSPEPEDSDAPAESTTPAPSTPPSTAPASPAPSSPAPAPSASAPAPSPSPSATTGNNGNGNGNGNNGNGNGNGGPGKG